MSGRVQWHQGILGLIEAEIARVAKSAATAPGPASIRVDRVLAYLTCLKVGAMSAEEAAEVKQALSGFITTLGPVDKTGPGRRLADEVVLQLHDMECEYFVARGV